MRPLLFLSFLFAVQTAFAAPSLDKAYGNIPLAFTLNEGQAPSAIRFTARGSGCGMAFSPSGTTFLLSRETAGSVARRAAKKSVVFEDDPTRDNPEYESFALNLSFIGANENPEIQGEDRLPWNNNYFIGNNPDKWRTDVPNYKKIRFKEVYSGIDLVYYGNQKRVKYDFVVKPGEDPNKILLKYNFGEVGGTLSVNEKGELVVKTPVGELVEEKPYCYQKINGKEVGVAIRYEVVEGGAYRFRVGEYDTGYDLVIDPEVVYSTYLGGTGDDSVAGIAVDEEGCAYVTGETQWHDFPITQGSFNTSYRHIFVTKLNSTGTALEYSTFFGGTEGFNYSLDIKADKFGDAYLTGWTQSSDFPITPNAFSKQIVWNDVFVTKLNPSGNGLVYSTSLGGADIDYAYGLAIDRDGCAYITGKTGSSNFPITPNAYRPTKDINALEGFLTKLNPEGSNLIYSTFLGKTGYSSAFRVAVDSTGYAVVAGCTEYSDFPVTPGALHLFHGGVWDVFVTKINPNGTKALYSALFGGVNNDGVGGIFLDSAGNAYICGTTESSDFPTTSQAYQREKSQEKYDGFIAKLSIDGSGFEYSTLLGSTDKNASYTGVMLNDIAINDKGKAYIIGTALTPKYPTTSDALFNLSYGIVLTVLSADGSTNDFSTYFGEGEGHALAIDNKGNIYLAGGTGSKVFPITPGAYDDSLAISTDESGTIIASHYDGFVSKIHLDNISTNIESITNPSQFSITSIYPNPFNPSTSITFSLPSPSPATLAIYSVTGQKVATLLSGPQPAGNRTVRWDASNFASGVYLCRLEADGKAVTRKITLVK